MAHSSTTPSPIALVVCDNVYQERSGKHALVGLFNRITARKFPVTHPRMCVFVSVTDIRPNSMFRLDVIDGETDENVIGMQGPPPKGSAPNDVVDMVFELHGVTFKRAGLYFIRFWGNEHLLLQRPFLVSERSH